MANHLQNETSPYLLQHADNPVEWYPWGEEALRAAKEQDKPIFLSIGYAACHWCHVMAHESFEDPQVAALMNEHYINIKVDREERPDLDAIYMDAVVAMTGQGGWPMSVFLTPDGEPFFGGTYFPPSRRHNLPSFQEILTHLAGEWQDNRARLVEVGNTLTQQLQKTRFMSGGEESLDRRSLQEAAETLFKQYDWRRGGWGGAPKFPQASVVEFLLQKAEHEQDKLALNMAVHALRSMAAGGIYDHVGGGFHRYAVDGEWIVPHFEKMLYDNALLLRAYLHAWQMTGESVFREVVEETIQFLFREMRHPEGGFFSSLDADSEGEEGKYYLWSMQEIHALLQKEDLFDSLSENFEIREEGNFEGSIILHRRTHKGEQAGKNALPEWNSLKEAREILLEARQKRIRPETDDKILTSWNALILLALAESAAALQREDVLTAAQELAAFLLDELIVEDGLQRSWRRGRARFSAYLEDYAALGMGLLALYQVDFSPRWYEAARDQAEIILSQFTDPDGGFFDTRKDQEQLLVRPKSLQDSPTPSGNTLAVSLLLRLYSFSGDQRYLNPAVEALEGIFETAVHHPTAFAGWLQAANFAIGPRWQLALIGVIDDGDLKPFLNHLQDRYLPRWVIAAGVKPPPELLKGRERIDGRVTAYLCRGFTCKLPTNDVDVFREQVRDAK